MENYLTMIMSIEYMLLPFDEKRQLFYQHPMYFCDVSYGFSQLFKCNILKVFMKTKP